MNKFIVVKMSLFKFKPNASQEEVDFFYKDQANFLKEQGYTLSKELCREFFKHTPAIQIDKIGEKETIDIYTRKYRETFKEEIFFGFNGDLKNAIIQRQHDISGSMGNEAGVLAIMAEIMKEQVEFYEDRANGYNGSNRFMNQMHRDIKMKPFVFTKQISKVLKEETWIELRY